jgi:hypothetical protein
VERRGRPRCPRCRWLSVVSCGDKLAFHKVLISMGTIDNPTAHGRIFLGVTDLFKPKRRVRLKRHGRVINRHRRGIFWFVDDQRAGSRDLVDDLPFPEDQVDSQGDAMLKRVAEATRRRSSEHDDDEGDDSESFYMDAPVDIAPKEVNLSGESGKDPTQGCCRPTLSYSSRLCVDAEDKLANTLVITVIRARQLPLTALRSAPSCYVKLSSMGREAKTSVMTRTDEPVWNETFSFRAVDWASPVTLSVRDRSSIKMRFIGQVRVSATELSTAPGMARQRWLRLQDKNWDKKVGEAEIELKMALTYSKRHDPNVRLESALRDEREAAAIGIMVDQEEETEEEALARRRELERQERERKSVMFSNIKQGDYQVQVHIIEARDLKGENVSLWLEQLVVTT